MSISCADFLKYILMQRNIFLIILIGLFSSLFAQKVPKAKFLKDFPGRYLSSFTEYDGGYIGFINQGNWYFGDTLKPAKLVKLSKNGDVEWEKSLGQSIYPFMLIHDKEFLLFAYNLTNYTDKICNITVEHYNLGGDITTIYNSNFNTTNFQKFASIDDNNNYSRVVLNFKNGVNVDQNTLFEYDWSKQNLTTSACKQLDFTGFPYSFLKTESNKAYIYWAGYAFCLLDKDLNFVKSFSVPGKYTFKQGGDVYKDSINGGYIGFGECASGATNDNYELVMVHINDSLELDSTLVIHNAQSKYNVDYIGLEKTFIKIGKAYYGCGVWDLNVNLIYEIDTTANKMVVCKFSENLNLEWTKTFGGDRRYLVNGIMKYGENGLVLYGYSRGKVDDYVYIPFMLFIDENGNITSTDNPDIKYDFTIYGNPGKNQLRINASYPDHNINIKVSDMQGRQVFRGNMQQGMNTYDASNWANGTYVVNATDKSGKLLWATKWVKME